MMCIREVLQQLEVVWASASLHIAEAMVAMRMMSYGYPKAGLTFPHGVHLDGYYFFESRCMGLLGL
jgi:hypothetical protein